MMISVSAFSLVAAPLISFVVTFVFILWFIKYSAIKILDHPNYRSLHTKSIHRVGGFGLMLGVLAAWGLLPVVLPLSVWVGVCLLVLISFADDIFGLSVWFRLLIHCVAAVFLAAVLLFDTHGWLITAIAAISIIWMTNLYNFMDGSDGLAGGMTLIGFSFYGLAALLGENEMFAMINFSIASAAMAFLFFNFYPARVFMGDAGAIPLGFLAAVLGLLGWVDSLWPVWLPLLVFSPFIVDASVTLAKRSLRGEKVWQAHRDHYYQRLVKNGFGHRNTALLEYILMLAVGASAVWAVQQEAMAQFGVGVVWSVVYLILIVVSGQYWRSDRSER